MKKLYTNNHLVDMPYYESKIFDTKQCDICHSYYEEYIVKKESKSGDNYCMECIFKQTEESLKEIYQDCTEEEIVKILKELKSFYEV